MPPTGSWLIDGQEGTPHHPKFRTQTRTRNRTVLINADLSCRLFEGLLASWLKAARAFDSDQGSDTAESVDK